MKSLLPVILVVLLLTGAITYSLAKRTVPKEEESRFGISANLLEPTSIDNSDTGTSKKTGFNFVTPTPSAKPSVAPLITPTATPTITPTPTKTPESVLTLLPTTDEQVTSKGGVVTTKKVTRTTKTIVCTPVYGQANTCTEHIVVDTGASDAIFFNFAGLSYFAGLASFIFAKRS